MLIAEDDRETVVLYKELFAEEDRRVTYEIDVATTASECLSKLRDARTGHPYDILLMDLSLGDDLQRNPERSLLFQLRRRISWVPRLVLAVSGISPYHFSAKSADLAALGAIFIAKPFDIEELLQTVYALVTGGTAALPHLAQQHITI
jgi:CheY-like chemotaxis protein